MKLKSGLILLALLLQGCNEPGNSVSQSPATSPNDWAVYNGGPDSTHYSTLAQINRSNVGRLQVAWTYDSGDAFRGSEVECNPIIVHGVLYAATPKGNVVALNGATGQPQWRFDPNPGANVTSKQRIRGVTYWSDGHDERIFVAVQQYLYSLDARTGLVDPLFGHSGNIDLRDDLGRATKEMATMTSPGIIYKDMLIVGTSLAESLPCPPGDIRAYDVHTGKLRWIFHTIPHPGEFGYETWPKDGWIYGGAANDWAGFALDVKRGLLFASTGSASADFYGANRVGDLLFANSIIALNADTGERVWHYQTVHHDLWDRDLPAPATLVTVNHDGHPVDAVAQITKSGYVFLFDRDTGKSLFPIEERKFPASDLEGEVTSPTQPIPLAPEPFARQQLTADMITQRTPQAHDDALAKFLTYRSAGQFVPGSREGTVIFPGFDGGGEWGGASYDPQSHLLYVNANEMAWILRLHENPAPAITSGKTIYLNQCAACHGPERLGSPPEFPSLTALGDHYSEADVIQLVSQGAGRMPGFARLGSEELAAVAAYVYRGADLPAPATAPSPFDARFISDGYNKFLDIDGYPAIQPPWGTLTAINLDTGKIAWQHPLGEYPKLVAQGVTNTGSENYGGAVVTAGGLLFIGATIQDHKFHVFDKDTGELLWETTMPFAGNATPSTYEVNGRQYVVIAAGGGKVKGDPSGALIIAFALPE